MSRSEEKNIVIDEATTHEIEVILHDQDDKPCDLSGFNAVFTSIYKGRKIEKNCIIEDNIVSIILSPEETTIPDNSNRIIRRYQIRIFNGSTVYEIIHGNLSIEKCHRNYITSPI